MTPTPDNPTQAADPSGPRPAGMPAAHPAHLGPYRILQVIGEGGMGVVYLAEQTEPMRRTVAIKMMKAGMDTREVIGRFETERQALAVMDHANIARVLDAGASEKGRPYFVMEYVRGVPLTEYCDRGRLSIRERLDLFVPVCRAVQHAHQKGIIHRDIKPSNILVAEVDGVATPKIIDFGIAKAVDWRLSARTFATERGRQLGTPAYMSPEQWEASGLDVDTRTDVYSLGVVLFELLVGRLPVDPDLLVRAGSDASSVLQASAPPTPSARLVTPRPSAEAVASFRDSDPEALRRAIAGDLDWIVMRAMESDRRRRYQTAQELAADIGRHLVAEPVLARPPSVRYRLGRFVRRHRVGTAVAAALLLIGVGFTSVTAAQAGRLAREKARAELAASRASAFGGFLREALLSPDPVDGLGRDATMLEVLDSAAARLARQPVTPPSVAAAVMSDIGWAYYKLGFYDRAEPLLAGALDLRTRDPQADSAELAESLLRMGAMHEKRDRSDSAAARYREALELRRRGVAGGLSVAEALVRSGSFWRERDDTAAARLQLTEALALFERAGDSAGIAAAQDNLGLLVFNTGDPTEAARLIGASVAYRRRRFGEHPLVVEGLTNLGVILEDLKRPAEAESAYREALRIGVRVLGERHDVVTATLNNLGLLLGQGPRVREAEALLRRALHTDEVVLGRDNPAVGVDVLNLAALLCRAGDPVAGEAMGRRGLAIFNQSAGDSSWQSAQAKVLLGRCLGRQRRFGEAESLLVEGLAGLERRMGPSHWRVDSTQSYLADVRRARQ